jgi:hypothetical protein
MNNDDTEIVGEKFELALVDKNATNVEVTGKDEDTITFFIGTSSEVDDEGLPKPKDKK